MAALVAVGLLVPLTGNSFAAEPTRAAPAAAAPPGVTLPTGDRVEVFADGALGFAADVRHYGQVLPNGDRVAIPAAALADVRQGRLDARLFNVDALLRHGITDAATVSPEVLGAPASAPTGAATTVTVDFAWLDGSVPTSATVWWLNQATGDDDMVSATDDVASAELPPGEYSLLLVMDNGLPDDAPWEVVSTVADLTVTDTPAALAMDGTTAKPVTVDRADAVTHTREVQFYANRTDGSRGITHLYGVRGTDQMYAIPSAEPAGHTAGLSLRSELTNPAGAAEPYSYDLFNLAERGIPADPMFAVHDSELAVRHATYHGLGGKPVRLNRRNLSNHADRQPFGYLPGTPVMVPSTRTEFYTADPDVTWGHLGVLGGANDGDPGDDVLHNGGVLTAGEQDEHWLSGPLSVRAPNPRFPYYGAGIERWPAGAGGQPAALLARMPLFSSGAPNEVISSYTVPGKATISKDGVELATSPDGTSVVAELPKDDSGRFTVTMDATRDVPWTIFGSHSTATWVFDSAAVTEAAVLGVSAVRFDSPDVVDGYAKRGEPQRVELEYETQNGAPDRSCAGMTFEVSYDDGATWAGVDITRDGDHATATVNHPAGAEFVSVRFTAVDDLGQTVETSTIRSFGLR
jgi:hypothetical protein